MASDDALVRFKNLEYFASKIPQGDGGSSDVFPDYLLQTLQSDGTANTGTDSALYAKNMSFTYASTAYDVYRLLSDKDIHVKFASFAQNAYSAAKASSATSATTATKANSATTADSATYWGSAFKFGYGTVTLNSSGTGSVAIDAINLRSVTACYYNQTCLNDSLVVTMYQNGIQSTSIMFYGKSNATVYFVYFYGNK